MLRGDHFAPGQYRVATWPIGGPQRVVGTLYRLAD
jgi:hypothetical protein